jgi:hypothetical protein
MSPIIMTGSFILIIFGSDSSYIIAFFTYDIVKLLDDVNKKFFLNETFPR